jgi:hypothetical protein
MAGFFVVDVNVTFDFDKRLTALLRAATAI